MICRKSKRLSKKSERTPVWSANAFGLHSPRRLKIWRVFAPKMHRAVALHGSVPNCQSPKFLSAVWYYALLEPILRETDRLADSAEIRARRDSSPQPPPPAAHEFEARMHFEF